MSVQPDQLDLGVGQVATFIATVQNTADTSVDWLVNGVPGGNSTVGTISSGGYYQAPDMVPSPAEVTITAVSRQDPSKSDQATVHIRPVVTLNADRMQLRPGADVPD